MTFTKPTPEQFAAAEAYHRTLRLWKKHGVTLDGAPEDVQQAVLALHQNALVVEGWKRQERKKK